MEAYNLFIASICILFTLDCFTKGLKYRIFIMIAIVVTIAFTVLRDYVGYDYANYVDYFTRQPSDLASSGIEPGFIYVINILHLFTDNYFWFFFTFGAATLLLIIRGISLYTTNIKIAFLIYLLTPGLFLNSFSILRQAMAIALLFNAFYYYYSKRYCLFVIWSIIACGFHYTVIVALPFLCLSTKIANHAKQVVLLGIPVSLCLYRLNIVPTLISFIFGTSHFSAYAAFTDGGTSLFKLIVLNSVIILYLLCYKHFSFMDRVLFVIVGIGLMLTNICADVAAITRIGYYFRIFDCVLLANIVGFIKSPNKRLGLIMLICLYYYAMFYNALIVDLALPYTPKLTPYKMI